MLATHFPALFALTVALAAGLIIGMERGWKEREAAEGSRVAGLRTFGLIGLGGGIAGALGHELGGIVLAAGIIGIVALAAIGYWIDRGTSDNDVSMTSAVAMLVTFGLGALSGIGQPEHAAALAVMAALLLGLKPALHATLRAMSRRDLMAALQLLLVSLVVLPLLPDRTYGPQGVLNPYRLWWIVVLVAATSFTGYVAIRLIGHRRGMLALGFFGGLVSSTAVSLTLARSVRAAPGLGSAAAGGVLAATTVMAARIGIMAGLLAPDLIPHLLPAVVAAIAAGTGATVIAARKVTEASPDADVNLVNPLELRIAVQYAVLVAAVLLLSHLLLERLGPTGLYGVAALGGLIDVDAPVVSAATLVASGLPVRQALVAIAIAVVANSIFKLGLLAAYGDGRFALRVAIGYAAMAVAAAVAAILLA